MFKEDTLLILIKNWLKYKPEDELYYKLQENPYYPFKMLSEGYYYVVVQSDRAAYGIWCLLAAVIAWISLTLTLGFYALPQCFFIICIFFCLWTLRGRIAWRELIISRRGRGSYMLRVLQNQEKLIQHELRNVYIRLTKKNDASGDPHFWLNLSGYELDDYRITRMTKAENALRIMGMRLAYRLGVNFFDWKDESEEHLIFHYKTYTKLNFQHQLSQQNKGKEHKDSHKPDKDSPKQSKPTSFLSVPSRKGRTTQSGSGSGSDMDPSPSKQRKMNDGSLDDARFRRRAKRREPRKRYLNN